MEKVETFLSLPSNVLLHLWCPGDKGEATSKKEVMLRFCAWIMVGVVMDWILN